MSLPELYISRIPNSPYPYGKIKGGASPNREGSPFFIRTDYPGLEGVIDKMRELVTQGKGDPVVRAKAVEITKGIKTDPRTGLPNRRDFSAIADAVYKWMKSNVAYVRDPDGIEWLQTAKKTLELKFGDCDDQSILAGALLSSIGVPVRFKVVKANPQKRDSFSHVYLQYQDKGSWIGFDPTLHSKAGDELSDYQIFGHKTVDLAGVELKENQTMLYAVGIGVVVGLSWMAYRHRNQRN